jgi:hypothetical protein
VNWYFLCPEFGVHKDVTKLITTMCIIGASMGFFTKLPWPVWLGADVGVLDGLAKILPDLYSYSTAGTPESCMFESMCGPKVRTAWVCGNNSARVHVPVPECLMSAYNTHGSLCGLTAS